MPDKDPLGDVRDGYDAWSPVYDHDENPLPALEEPVVHDLIGDPTGLAILDLGCGTGRHALRLAPAAARVTALDFSAGMLAEARRKPGSQAVQFLQHDLHEPLPFPEAAFDLVVSGLVLEHLRDTEAFFRQVRRILRPGGRAVVSSLHPFMFLRGSRARFIDAATGESHYPGSRPHTFGELVLAPTRAGLALAAIEEVAPDPNFAARYPRVEKYVGWPMLVVLGLVVPS